ncbi:bifunctional 23S rRNA (guanine(2069)-N(7))-methyltransferase RlmK/23S rRNA (guanine(2445)-N(2))-methyltransferase RlmL [Thalassotalea sp. Y01]|uniref:bifunctional 23S rRNA (guanine(2069)-N(7))-methyltransferase RlmK/23S rRNA (guanine(2445)-N(2))-methyltransferase RlmL n=1 Tax=Thalassotalea sp. Y01 TaxID=2729613 RepID=UPI00145E7C17|nr:bifunctional 23S rRNA (guanine(2069)-N(7))-methyltransferase RlmK/23S rRNA (guanine(2445)-N(2))-methyltransferase RlmL [Thalassotalea sp. Y01]NMP15262.1 bifunctional 23S rRNA (guanine(2069)-N(7))-methyltransferase RlmK/23S rRNA (guanine(2445)-N(2))-methyltransferase RlmL [Thalassotalea sp. Y01]
MNQYLALTSFGIEQLLSQELTELGAEQVIQKPEGVYFQASMELAFKICLKTRLASRVLIAIADPQPIKTKDELYNAAKDIDWTEQFDSDKFFAIDFVGKNEHIRDSQFGALTVKDAVVDCFREVGLERPSVEKFQPDVRIQARLVRNAVTFYIDFSGRALFQRGYRESTGAAPIKENLAAAMVLRSGWLADTSKPLIDPMCGSGTLLLEAISMAAGISPGVDRAYWGFEGWNGFDKPLFDAVLAQEKAQSEQALASCDIKVYGFDMDDRVLKTAKINARNAGLANFIEFKHGRAEKLENTFNKAGHILFNPPYGERLSSLPGLVATFTELGMVFKAKFLNWQVALITSNTEMLSLLKLSSKKRYKFKNGPLECQMALYDIDDKQVERTPAHVSEGDMANSAFANRLKKNVKAMKSWLKQNDINCYRLYDADIPEYNVAVDIYDDHLVIFEYAPPKSIDEKKAAERLQEVVFFAPKVLDIPIDKVVVKTRSKQKGKNQYQKLSKTKRYLTVKEYGAWLKVNLWDYLDTGLFLDHRKTRQIVAQKAKGKRVLNLFAYTGSVSVQAAIGGAESVTTVDMSNTYLDWAKDNFEANGLRTHKYQFVQADCLQWLTQNREKFDLVFIDPPTFSNSKRMNTTFDVQRDHVDLIKSGMQSVSDGGELIFTNNKRNFKMDFDAMQENGFTVVELSSKTLDFDFKRNKHIHNSWLITRN